MRITGGQAKGRRLAGLKGLSIRPTSDRVREAIFNLIGHDLTESKVLDLFAGTGSLGLEALSRGALWALFIDHAPQSLKLIEKNLSLCGFQSNGFILKKDLSRGLPRKHELIKRKVNLVFMDPPYGRALIPRMMNAIMVEEILEPSSIIIAESSKKERLPSAFGNLFMEKSKVYGDTRIDIFRSL